MGLRQQFPSGPPLGRLWFELKNACQEGFVCCTNPDQTVIELSRYEEMNRNRNGAEKKGEALVRLHVRL